jgi:hypothetical protein
MKTENEGSNNFSIGSRKAIEAMRAGVPNRDAVRVMGSSQPELEALFKEKLETVPQTFVENEQVSGLLIAGDFGNGKSHLLEYFKYLALESNFVCSKIAISKETPLYDSAKVFRAAIESAKVPGKLGSAIVDVANQLDFESEKYADFYKWVQSSSSGISPWFAATLYLYEYARHDEDIRDEIVRFWAGDKMQQGKLKRYLKDCGQSADFKIDRLSVKEAAKQRYLFVPRLMIAAGYSGWVILADEMELIGRYSFKQRTKSYASFAKLMGGIRGDMIPGLTCVFSISADFEAAVLDGKGDEEKIRLRCGNSLTPEEGLLAQQAEVGMNLIRKRNILTRLSREALLNSYEKLKTVYQQAYNWQPVDVLEQPDMTSRMRQHIKRWITWWDLKRIYPDYQPEIEVSQLNPKYSENVELEVQDENENDEQGMNQ